jgi:hypothetical protein
MDLYLGGYLAMNGNTPRYKTVSGGRTVCVFDDSVDLQKFIAEYHMNGFLQTFIGSVKMVRGRALDYKIRGEGA